MLKSRLMTLARSSRMPGAVDAAQLDGRKVGDGLVLRPLDLVLDDVAPERDARPVQLLAGGLVDVILPDCGSRNPTTLSPRNGFAALGDDEFRRRVVRRLVDRPAFRRPRSPASPFLG